jgi:Ala-tRNA(Pro) deacylase
MNIQEYLARQNIQFEVLKHRATYDAQHLAQSIHVSGHHVAKTVLLRVGDGPDYVVAVLPASQHVDLEKLRVALGVDFVELASETEVAERCPDCEIGALPPFGSHYGMKTVVDQTLVADEDIVFEGITHAEAIKMKYHDFDQLEHPTVATVCA